MFLPGGVKERRAEANLEKERIENEGNATQRWWSGPEKKAFHTTMHKNHFPPNIFPSPQKISDSVFDLKKNGFLWVKTTNWYCTQVNLQVKLNLFWALSAMLSADCWCPKTVPTQVKCKNPGNK
jgi:hypothetical protein